jgi:transposase
MSFRYSSAKKPAKHVVKDIRRPSRRHFSAEDKIRVVLDSLCGKESIVELCRKEGITPSLYYTWSTEFMEAVKRRLAGDTARAATSDEVKDLRREASALKECVADLTLENRLLKNRMVRPVGKWVASSLIRSCTNVSSVRHTLRFSFFSRCG